MCSWRLCFVPSCLPFVIRQQCTTSPAPARLTLHVISTSVTEPSLHHTSRPRANSTDFRTNQACQAAPCTHIAAAGKHITTPHFTVMRSSCDQCAHTNMDTHIHKPKNATAAQRTALHCQLHCAAAVSSSALHSTQKNCIPHR
ncbi:hypothetical protein COO60DRAFT_1221959 [Scenedesmus sp. NREL 46B-D3]|nr:hypothetical protein COO60DRAFT_1221959 [Scenedesmus sp. NREL 46B-D3]